MQFCAPIDSVAIRFAAPVERYNFLEKQNTDLENSKAELLDVIATARATGYGTPRPVNQES